LRCLFESSFRHSGLPCPNHLVETASPMVVTRLLVESDLVAILPRDVAAQYSACGLITELPVELACDMDPYGVITRKGWLLSPAAQLICDTIEDEALQADRIRQTVDAIQ